MLPTTCENFTSPHYTSAEQILYGYTLPAICLIGAIANILTIVVLIDRRLAAPTYIYLIYLAIADLITLLLYYVDLISRMHFASQLWSQIFTAYVYLPLGSISTGSSLLLTVAVTIDRYIFIQNPTAITSRAIPAAIQLAEPRSRARKMGGMVCLISAIINLPRMAAWYVNFDTGCRASREWAADPNGWFSIYSYVRLLFLNIGSIFMLATFNFLLIVLVQRSTSRRENRQSYSSCKSGDTNGSVTKSTCITSRAFTKANVSLTVTLIAATLLALSGEIPSTLFSRISASVIWKGDNHVLEKEPYRYFVLMAYILILLEYSGNFVIYCVLNKRFRMVLRSKIWTKKIAKYQPKDLAIFSGDRKRRSVSLDLRRLTNNGSSLRVTVSNKQNSLGDNTDNFVTRGGGGGGFDQTEDDPRENLSEFWRTDNPDASIKPVRTSKSFPAMLVRISASESAMDTTEDMTRLTTTP